MDIVSNQTYIFLIYVLTGIIIGLIFDVFRAIRRSFRTKDSFTYIQDILFWLLTGSIVMYVTFKFSYGQIRAYMLLGTVLGGVFYLLTFSNVFMNVLIKILLVIKNVIKNIIVVSIKKAFKLISKPIKIICINIKINLMSKDKKTKKKDSQKGKKPSKRQELFGKCRKIYLYEYFSTKEKLAQSEKKEKNTI